MASANIRHLEAVHVNCPQQIIKRNGIRKTKVFAHMLIDQMILVYISEMALHRQCPPCAECCMKEWHF